ncbi:MAG: hypothetical protein EBV06_05845 [Planctomycetia bacterium]|nr:hypothetical protein [Planctomycetia bacterium]
MNMFRPQTYTKPGVTLGFPVANKKLVDGPDEEVLEQKSVVPAYKVQAYGSSTRLFTKAYQDHDAGKYDLKLKREPSGQFGALLSEARMWQDTKDTEIRARRIMRGDLAIQGMQPALDKLFRIPASAQLPSGDDAKTAYSDFARISAMLQTNDFANLVRPETIQAIVRGVYFRVSTPLFSSFVAYMRSPTTGLLPPQISSRNMFIDLVKRAVLAQNPAYKWEDFVSADATMPPVQPQQSAPAGATPTTQPAKDSGTESMAGEGKFSGRG